MAECVLISAARIQAAIAAMSRPFEVESVSDAPLGIAFVVGGVVLAGVVLVYCLALQGALGRLRGRPVPTCDIEVARLFVYPIKSCAAVEVESALITPRGLENDRVYMVVDANNRFMTLRKCPRMALVHPFVTSSGGLVITAKNRKFEHTPRTNGEVVAVAVWKSECMAIDQGDEVAQFLADFLDMPNIRLVMISQQSKRHVDSPYVTSGQYQISFADGYPFLVASENSLREVSEKVGRHMSVKRFRPNIVFKGGMHPFDEDFWETIKIGDALFTLTKICARCKVPTVDPETGSFDSDNQPTVALREFRSEGKKVFFGQNAVCTLGEGTRISVGDKVTVKTMYAERRV